MTTEEIRQLSHERVSSWAIQEAAVRNGMRTLRDDGWVKVIDGRTTIDEVHAGDQRENRRRLSSRNSDRKHVDCAIHHATSSITRPATRPAKW